ncbi:hypothetical protein EVAR_99091_1 [Eumeta japonica]|uniref:Uncharacterized protein n=1 Tax=Eumeta variegata TaxID=151549 RepID=A0A4C1ZNI9_EUMVA|nr:hypothetical protein EVAR_99091_1 [Eumeta japonica]
MSDGERSGLWAEENRLMERACGVIGRGCEVMERSGSPELLLSGRNSKTETIIPRLYLLRVIGEAVHVHAVAKITIACEFNHGLSMLMDEFKEGRLTNGTNNEISSRYTSVVKASLRIKLRRGRLGYGRQRAGSVGEFDPRCVIQKFFTKTEEVRLYAFVVAQFRPELLTVLVNAGTYTNGLMYCLVRGASGHQFNLVIYWLVHPR